MSEILPHPQFEEELRGIQSAIETKRGELEREGGIVDETIAKETAREVIKSQVSELSEGQTAVAPAVESTRASMQSSETDSAVHTLVQTMYDKGLKVAISDARKQHPYILDAFHDVLVDKLYEELKKRNMI